MSTSKEQEITRTSSTEQVHQRRIEEQQQVINKACVNHDKDTC
jgi:hypothetical protein